MGQDRHRGYRGAGVRSSSPRNDPHESIDSFDPTRNERHMDMGQDRHRGHRGRDIRSSRPRNGSYETKESFDPTRNNRRNYDSNDRNQTNLDRRMARSYGSSDRSRFRENGHGSKQDDYRDG